MSTMVLRERSAGQPTPWIMCLMLSKSSRTPTHNGQPSPELGFVHLKEFRKNFEDVLNRNAADVMVLKAGSLKPLPFETIVLKTRSRTAMEYVEDQAKKLARTYDCNVTFVTKFPMALGMR